MPSTKRDKYTARACVDCQRRKIKCSGDEPSCGNCVSRSIPCEYENNQRSRRAAKKARLEDGILPDVESEEHRNSSSAEELRKENERFRKEIQRLREDINRLFGAKIGNTTSNGSDGAPGSTPGTDSVVDGAAQTPSAKTDTFEAYSPWPSRLAVSSLISVLRSYVGRSDDEPPPPPKGETLFITLPRPEFLQSLVNQFFYQFDCYFPFLDRVNFKKRISEAFKGLSYSETNRRVSVACQHYKTMAILCAVLAFGAPFIPDAQTDEERPGWTQYLQGKHLMQATEIPGDDDLDVVLYHTVSSAYLFHGEMLRAAMKHMVQALQAAQVMGLNDQSKWKCRPLEIAFRKSLFWTLYFLDKRITQKSGIAYFIREQEVAVDDFSEEHNSTEYRDVNREDQQFIQAMIQYSKLWTRTWDTLFAPKATNANNWEEILILDARIMIAEKKLSPRLRWETDKLDELVAKGEEEYRICRRLVVYTRLQDLRLTIRESGISDQDFDTQRRRSCFNIAKDVVEAVEKYMSRYMKSRAAEYMITSTLVKSIYHIVPESRDPNTPLDKDAVLKTLRTASNSLKALVKNVSAANRAFRALRCVLLLDEDEPIEVASEEKSTKVPENEIPEQGNSPSDPVQMVSGQEPKLPSELWMPQYANMSADTATAQMMDTTAYMFDQNQAVSQPMDPNLTAMSLPQTSGPPFNFGGCSFFNLDVGWEVNELQWNQSPADAGFVNWNSPFNL